MSERYNEYCARINNNLSYMGRGIDFLASTTWLNNGASEERLFDHYCEDHAPCAIVGTVAAQNLHVDACGDFTPSMDIRDSHFRLTIQRPSALHPKFREDWDTSIRTLSALADTLCDNAKTSNLIVEQNGDVLLTFAKPVFRKKGPHDPSDIGPHDATQLPGAAWYTDLLMPLRGKYYHNTINVYRGPSARQSFPIWYHSDRLQGTLVQVNFNLIYSATEGLHADIYTVRLIERDRQVGLRRSDA
ncbi:hypothetical protein BJ912DRAFT_929192 [Pholiota molesta]|nr:hypothetical protein BJ912DRAFT_929192 [Pholiota molesta]